VVLLVHVAERDADPLTALADSKHDLAEHMTCSEPLVRVCGVGERVGSRDRYLELRLSTARPRRWNSRMPAIVKRPIYGQV
jgi:hypothetical protein